MDYTTQGTFQNVIENKRKIKESIDSQVRDTLGHQVLEPPKVIPLKAPAVGDRRTEGLALVFPYMCGDIIPLYAHISVAYLDALQVCTYH